MSTPSWDDPTVKAGSMVRGALWLVQVIGEGNTFTKAELRTAFPDIQQIDRRIRDLRDYGWLLLSNTEDARLTPEQTRFQKAGAAVWDPKERRAAAPAKSFSNKARAEVLERDSFMCTVCGIAGGEEYPDDPTQTAMLVVSRREVMSLSGTRTETLVTECKRCKAGAGNSKRSAQEVLETIEALSDEERETLLKWAKRGRRRLSALDRAWNRLIRLPSDAREEVIGSLF